jgi:hypothetical protein
MLGKLAERIERWQETGAIARVRAFAAGDLETVVVDVDCAKRDSFDIAERVLKDLDAASRTTGEAKYVLRGSYSQSVEPDREIEITIPLSSEAKVVGMLKQTAERALADAARYERIAKKFENDDEP